MSVVDVYPSVCLQREQSYLLLEKKGSKNIHRFHIPLTMFRIFVVHFPFVSKTAMNNLLLNGDFSVSSMIREMPTGAYHHCHNNYSQNLHFP